MWEKRHTHDMCNTRIYGIWNSMKSRCSDIKDEHHYKYYFGRGITVCDEWQGTQGFFNFLKWSLENGYNSSLTIDRKDTNGNYEPSNCRWADWNTQANNRRKPQKVVNQYGVWDYKKPLPEPFKERD